jgi:lipid-binding SYLF domain-containing protein
MGIIKFQLEGFHMKKYGLRKNIGFLSAMALLMSLVMAAGLLLQTDASHAASAKEIDVKVDVALEQFEKDIKGGKEFLKTAKGVLVFPSVIKAGIGIGGEYGEGALRIKGKTVDYYSTAAASIGFQLGAQSKRVILVFMQDDALKKFRGSSGWEAGVDGSVALVELGAGGTIDTTNIRDPIVGFVFGNKGLMYNLTLEGSKYTKIVR